MDPPVSASMKKPRRIWVRPRRTRSNPEHYSPVRPGERGPMSTNSLVAKLVATPRKFGRTSADPPGHQTASGLGLLCSGGHSRTRRSSLTRKKSPLFQPRRRVRQAPRVRGVVRRAVPRSSVGRSGDLANTLLTAAVDCGEHRRRDQTEEMQVRPINRTRTDGSEPPGSDYGSEG